MSRIILAGRGSDPDVAGPRAIFVNLALQYGHAPAAIGELIKRSADQVMGLHQPRKTMGDRQRKLVESFVARLAK